MIEVRGIYKAFKGKTVLKDINLAFERGRVNMIIGASGAGKSVLLKTVVGLLEPDMGEVFFEERPFFSVNKEQKKNIRRDIGMLFQGGALFDSLNVEQNVMFPLDMLTKIPLEEKKDRVEECLVKVGLAGANQKMPSELSGGMKKRVGIARAIVNRSKYLFCDEPNSGLDPQTSIKIDDLIFDITKEFNLHTVVISHDMNSLMQVGEKISFIYNSEIVWKGERHEIINSGVEVLDNFIFSNNMMKKFKTYQ